MRSTWTMTGALYVGGFTTSSSGGSGTLDITNGGAVSDTTGNIACKSTAARA